MRVRQLIKALQKMDQSAYVGVYDVWGASPVSDLEEEMQYLEEGQFYLRPDEDELPVKVVFICSEGSKVGSKK